MSSSKFPPRVWIDKDLIDKETGNFYQDINGVKAEKPIYAIGNYLVMVPEAELTALQTENEGLRKVIEENELDYVETAVRMPELEAENKRLRKALEELRGMKEYLDAKPHKAWHIFPIIEETLKPQGKK